MDPLVEIRLAAINPLGSLLPEQRRSLFASGELLEPLPGVRLFEQGESDDVNYYLLHGSVRIAPDGAEGRLVEAGSDSANYALGNLQPRPYAVLAGADCRVLRLPRARVDAAVAREQVVAAEFPSMTVTDLADGAPIDGAWMCRLLQSALFRDLPTENIERFFTVIERCEHGPGETIIEQGEAGEHFYMIAAGECEVMRNVGGLSFPIATLTSGESFGEEALIAHQPRNATVRTRDAAVLMRLKAGDFTTLFEAPAIRRIAAAEAIPLIKRGACLLLDVRMENEHGARKIRDSLNIPLYRLRREAEQLDEERPIITYCDTGLRSKVAAFLLSQRGRDARYVDGGLSALLRPA